MDSNNDKKDENIPNVPPEKTAEVNPEDTKLETSEKKEGKKKCCKGKNRCGRGMGPCDDPWNMPPGMRRMCPWGSFPMQHPFMPPMGPPRRRDEEEDFEEQEEQDEQEDQEEYEYGDEDYDYEDYYYDECRRRKCSKGREAPCPDEMKGKPDKPPCLEENVKKKKNERTMWTLGNATMWKERMANV